MVRLEFGQLGLQHTDVLVARLEQQRLALTAHPFDLGQRRLFVRERLGDTRPLLRHVGQVVDLVLGSAALVGTIGQLERLLRLAQLFWRLGHDLLVRPRRRDRAPRLFERLARTTCAGGHEHRRGEHDDARE